MPEQEVNRTDDKSAQASACMLTVYYDGACPLCRKEINFFRRRSNDNNVEWVDASLSDTDAVAADLTRSAALTRFHVRLPDGSLQSGARGFAELWAVMPGFGWLGRFARGRLVSQPLEIVYRGFLRARPVLQRIVARFEA